MNARQYGMFGLLALGLTLAIPARAASGLPDPWIVAARDDYRYEDRDQRRDDRRERRDYRREKEDGAYGTGYERRRQQRDSENDDRSRRRR